MTAVSAGLTSLRHRAASRFKNLAMRVLVDKVPTKDSEVAAFIDDLKKDFPCLHFKATPAEAANEPPETLPAVEK